MLEEALATYRSTFQPSEFLAAPYVMVAAGVFGAQTDEEAAFLRSSQMLALPTHDIRADIPAPVLAQVGQALSCSATGSPETVRRELGAIINKYQPDELILTGMIHDHAARVRSFEIAAKALKSLTSG